MSFEASLPRDQSAAGISHPNEKHSAAVKPSVKDWQKFSVLMDFWKLRLGAGRPSLDEYLELRLFDRELYKGVDRKAFVGMETTRRIWLQANYRIDLFAMANNKIASAIWFAAHGLPILPTIALFHEAVGRPSDRLLRDEGELRAFLKKDKNYPLFGKPIEGSRSVGSASIESYLASNDSLVTTAGHLISLNDFVSYVKAHAASGYQFQARVSPHATVREMCGDRLATVRLLTIMRQGKPEILRACWKIPSGAHSADNFWRPGNLLAQLDLSNGRVTRVIRRAGTTYEEVSHHPDTGMRILGMDVPNWHEVTKLAMDGAELLGELPLVGWDIAPVDSGAVLVEPNVTPDLHLHQLADRRGVLDPAFASFLAQRKRDVSDFRRVGKPAGIRTRLAFFRDRPREAMRILMPGACGHQPMA